jgi:hypothetical protein
MRQFKPSPEEFREALAYASAHLADHLEGKATDAERAAVVLAKVLVSMCGAWRLMQRAAAMPESETSDRDIGNLGMVFDGLAEVCLRGPEAAEFRK